MSEWINLIKRSLPLDYPPSQYYYTYTSRAYLMITPWADGRSFKSILEVGCGSALACVCAKLMHPWKRVGACDISEEVIKFAKERCKRWGVNIELTVADARSLPYKDKEWDSSLSEGLIEHYPESERKQILLEMQRISRYQVIDVPINQRHPGIWGGYGDEFMSGTSEYWRDLIEETMTIRHEWVRERRIDGAEVRWGCLCK